jgi:hypothetical protein
MNTPKKPAQWAHLGGDGIPVTRSSMLACRPGTFTSTSGAVYSHGGPVPAPVCYPPLGPEGLTIRVIGAGVPGIPVCSGYDLSLPRHVAGSLRSTRVLVTPALHLAEISSKLWNGSSNSACSDSPTPAEPVLLGDTRGRQLGPIARPYIHPAILPDAAPTPYPSQRCSPSLVDGQSSTK